MTEEDLLKTEKATLPAPPNLRALNYLIDTLVIVSVELLLYELVRRYLNTFYLRIQFSENPVFTIQLFDYMFRIGYYTLLEALTNGQTIGKKFTRTRAVRTDGELFTIKEAFLRSLCRLIPFEAIICLFGYIIHDRWTNTSVAVERNRNLTRTGIS